MLVVAGDASNVLDAERLAWAKSLNKRVDVMSLPGGHLLPLEAPEACARVAAEFISAH